MVKNLIILICCVVLAIYGCNTPHNTQQSNTSQQNDTQTITDKRWKLVELNGQPIADSINGKEPFLSFQQEDNRYFGTAGCNGIGGSFTLLQNSRIKFTQGMSTMMACEHMETEQGLNLALSIADNYDIKDNELSLNKGRRAPLARFKAVEAKQEQTTALNGSLELNYISGPRISFEGLYPGKKPTISFNTQEAKAYGNSSCNSYNTNFVITGNNIQFNNPMSTKMACQGAGEASFFEALKTITQFEVDGSTLTLSNGPVAMMRFSKTQQQ